MVSLKKKNPDGGVNLGLMWNRELHDYANYKISQTVSTTEERRNSKPLIKGFEFPKRFIHVHRFLLFGGGSPASKFSEVSTGTRKREQVLRLASLLPAYRAALRITISGRRGRSSNPNVGC